MKFLILNSDYSGFMKSLYDNERRLEEDPYEKQMQVRMDSFFGTADSYSTNLRRLGHEAWDIIVNLAPAQKKWAEEHGLRINSPERWGVRIRRGMVPWPYRRKDDTWLYSILETQMKAYRPDILYCMAVETIGSDFLKSVKPYYRLAVGQHAAPHPEHDISEYDLMLSSLPNFVDHFQRKGMKSELLRLGFEPRILNHLSSGGKRSDLVFVGGVGGPHQGSNALLESLCHRFNIAIWGYQMENLPKTSPVGKAYMGPIWGIEMYQALRDGKIGFNRHIDIAGNYANNMRLYETTGVGTLLLTDHKSNISEMFVPDREVITYSDAEECIEQARYYLEHDKEREGVARAGQERTLREHTYYHRMQELVDIVRKHT